MVAVRILLLLAFFASILASGYFRIQAARRRAPGVHAMDPRILFGSGLTEEGLSYWRRSHVAAGIAFVVFLLLFAVWPKQ